MSESAKLPYMTAQEYLKAEESATARHEYVRGQIFAMTGSTEAHNIICGNVYVALHTFLGGSGCRAFQTDMKVRVEAADSFYYPDIMVTCEPFDHQSVFKSAPRLIIEVLSPSTKQIDKREKMVAYRQLPSLKQYVLIHQNKPLIESYMQAGEYQWQVTLLKRNDKLELQALPERTLTMAFDNVYEGIDFPSAVEEDEEEYLSIGQ